MTDKDELFKAIEVLANHCKKQGTKCGDCCYLYMFCFPMAMSDDIWDSFNFWKKERYYD